MKILLATALATVLVAPCTAKDDNSDNDKTQADVLTPGVNEPRVPDTLKPNADERIRTQGLDSERSGGRAPVAPPQKPDVKK